MADFIPAVEQTLENEKGFNINRRTGECVNFGINQWTLRDRGVFPWDSPEHKRTPATPAEIQYIQSMTKAYATTFYLQNYWKPGNYEKLSHQKLAGKTFDLGVNTGVNTSITLLQKACNRTGYALKTDGILGPLTIKAANETGSLPLVYLGLLEEATRYYSDIAQAPEHEGDLLGWLDRLMFR